MVKKKTIAVSLLADDVEVFQAAITHRLRQLDKMASGLMREGQVEAAAPIYKQMQTLNTVSNKLVDGSEDAAV